MAQDFAWVGSPSSLGLRLPILRPAEITVDLTTVDLVTAQVLLPFAAAEVTWTFTINTALTTATILVVEHAYQAGDTPDPGQAQGRFRVWVTASAGGVVLPPALFLVKLRKAPDAYPGP